MWKTLIALLFWSVLASTGARAASPAPPLQGDLGGANASCAGFEAYVQAAVSQLPNQRLPEPTFGSDFWGSELWWFNWRLREELPTHLGRSANYFCSVAFWASRDCAGQVTVNSMSTQGGLCGMMPTPTQAYWVVQQRASSDLPLGGSAAYIVFYHILTGDSCAVRISQIAPLTIDRYCASTANSTGSAARIELFGGPSLSTNDLVLRAAPVPDQVGLFFFGPSRTFLPFGDGHRCVGGTLQRLRPRQATGGALKQALDVFDPNSPASQLGPGVEWCFQAWYRDPASAGAGFNLSDAIAVRFCP